MFSVFYKKFVLKFHFDCDVKSFWRHCAEGAPWIQVLYYILLLYTKHLLFFSDEAHLYLTSGQTCQKLKSSFIIFNLSNSCKRLCKCQINM